VARAPGAVLERTALALLALAALMPLAGGVDARLDWALEAWRTCRGLALAERVSDLVAAVERLADGVGGAASVLSLTRVRAEGVRAPGLDVPGPRNGDSTEGDSALTGAAGASGPRQG